jgi:hypothetical protein
MQLGHATVVRYYFECKVETISILSAKIDHFMLLVGSKLYSIVC